MLRSRVVTPTRDRTRAGLYAKTSSSQTLRAAGESEVLRAVLSSRRFGIEVENQELVLLRRGAPTAGNARLLRKLSGSSSP